MRRVAAKLAVLTGLLIAVAAGVPASAVAVICPLPGANDPDFTPALDMNGTAAQSRAGGYVQLPFEVPAGTTAIRVRYSYDQPGGQCNPPTTTNTLDVGLYEPRDPGETVWGMDESRGWSGSAVRDLAVARNGFSDEATYDAAPRALVPGRTTRAYRPGPIPAGTWAVELGLAFLGADVEYRVLVETTADGDWSNDPYEPSGYSSAPVRSASGWYAGDFHVHGEQEPGNATMTDTFAAAFGPVGGGLDFVTLVDHNNNVAHDNLAVYQAANPNNLIIPGVEETTYRGHHNNHGKGPLTDFRGGPILQPQPLSASVPDSALAQVRGATPPSEAFAEGLAAGNLSQINHPEIFRGAPAACRGCAWSYDGAETDYTKVDSIEVQTGPAAIPANAPSAPNPFIADTLAFYESALDTGAHIAAVGSSDDHQGGTASGPFDSDVGHAATMVFAEELSEAGIKAGVRSDHTYVKFFGADGPDVSLTATAPGLEPAIIGDTLGAANAELTATVTGVEGSGRPGAWSVVLLKNGAPAETIPVSGNDFTHAFTASGPGRYSLQVVRNQTAIDFIEVYTSPIWLEDGRPDNRFRITKVKRNERTGNAKLTVKVPGPGALTVSGQKLEWRKREIARSGKVKLPVKAKTRGIERKLRRTGEAVVKPRIRYVPEGGEVRGKKKKVELRLRPKQG